jgi:hypothetical protein
MYRSNTGTVLTKGARYDRGPNRVVTSSAAKQWAQMEGRNCREMPGAAGLQRVLEDKSGDAGTILVCAMRARPAAACGRGALFVSRTSVPTKGWLDGLCSEHPGRHQASDKQRERRRWA